MNHTFPIKTYTQTDLNVRVENDDPHSIIQDILKELKNNLTSLLYSLENKPEVTEIKSKSFSKSLTAIYILQNSLNFEKGGEIANNLFKIYDFSRRSILEGFTNKDPELIKNVIPLIDEIIDAWQQIRKKI